MRPFLLTVLTVFPILRIHATPNDIPFEVREIILLSPAGRYVDVQMLEYAREDAKGNRFYIRNANAGRWLTGPELALAVSPEYFQVVHDSSPLRAALDSLWRFDAGARFQWHAEPNADRDARLVKLGLLGLTGLAFFRAALVARNANNSIRYINNTVPESRFRRMRTQYYAVLLPTIGYFGYTAARAYLNFGTDRKTGQDLEIPARRAMPSGEFISHARQGDGVAVSVRMEFAF